MPEQEQAEELGDDYQSEEEHDHDHDHNEEEMEDYGAYDEQLALLEE